MRNRSIRRLVGTGLAVGGLTVGALAVVPGASSGASVTPKVLTTLKVALPPGNTVPLSTFPFYDAANCLTVNIDYWQLTTRPGYWFGLGGGVTYQPSISPLVTPKLAVVGGNTVATVGIKGWLWSNLKGQKVKMTAKDVMFWLNMDKAQAKAGTVTAACGYAPNFGLPDGVLTVRAPKGLNGNVVQVVFKGKPDSQWILYNELSQIVPLAPAWDRTAGGASNCAAEKWSAITNSGTDHCSKVFTYLNGLLINNALWSWGDGPYLQKAAPYTAGQPNGNDIQVMNHNYSGPVKAHAVHTVVYVPFTLESTEFAALQSNKLQFGYADPSDVGTSPGPGLAGPNLKPNMGGYKTIGTLLFGVFYWMYNFDNSGSTYQTSGPLPDWASELNNTYFRGALQESINQPAVIAHVENNYGVPTFSAIPKYPANPFGAGVSNPYPYSTTKGRADLAAHGWDTSTTPATCAATNCGSSAFPIPHGAVAKIGLLVPSGDTAVQTQTNDEVNQIAAGADIEIDPTFEDSGTVAGACFGGAAAWELCGYGGWIYAPDYYPSGEVLFAKGSGSNSGGYSSTEMNALIAATTTNGHAALNASVAPYGTSFAEFSASDDPFLWQPTPTGFIEQAKSVKGALPPNPLNNFNPEYITAI
jgi:peptide/nickel transport system substrate-binding protein